MTQEVLMILHGALLLFFGVVLSAAFCAIQPTRKNALILLGLCVFCGVLQGTVLFFAGEELVWKLYPLITHLPLALFLRQYYKRSFITALAAVSTAYLCCQISKLFGIAAFVVTENPVLEYLIRILSLVVSAAVVLKWFAPSLNRIFLKERHNVSIFGALPAVYYCFDYLAVIYSDFWSANNQMAGEFLAFLLCVSFMMFCGVYYREYEQKADAERMEQIIRIAVQQQEKEMESVRRSEQEIRLIRHDVRLLLNSLSVCIASGENGKAQGMIAGYDSRIEETKLERFCQNDTVNYVLSYYAAKCRKEKIAFRCSVEMGELEVDENLFASILSNALDNAINAQLELPESQRSVRVVLKRADEKLLLSVKNPTARVPAFADGLPVSNRKDHGYGTQSIRHMTSRLGGKCQFSVHDGTFILRVIL